MDLLRTLFGDGGFLPHGYCFTWTPGLLWSMVGADTTIALAYFSIPLAILQFVRRRRDLALRWVPLLFSAFIFACGLTHVMDVWTIWYPDYQLQALIKSVTALVSLATAVALWPLLPRALRIPSVAQLQASIAALEREIERRRTAEGHAHEVEQNLAVTLESIGAGFLATGPDGAVTRMNRVAEQVTGWREGEARGRSLWEVFRHEDRPAADLALNPVDVALRDGAAADQAQEVTAISRLGTRTVQDVRSAVTRAGDGSVRGLVLVLKDQTSLAAAEAEAKRLAAIVESSSDAIVGKTLTGRITSWNRGAEQLFGYPAAEAIGQPIQMLIPGERSHEEMHILNDIGAGRRVPAFDTVRLAKGGRRIEVSVAISPVLDARGRVVGAAKIARGLDEQKRAAAALHEREERLRLAVDAAGIGEWELDPASGNIRRSLRHDRCFGYDQPPADWDLGTLRRHLHEDDREPVMARLEAALVDGSDWRDECRVVWPDGSLHWVGFRGRVVRLLGGALRMLGVVWDVTAQRNAEQHRRLAERLEAENLHIQEANKLKSQFLANMSHELRTPLTAIIGFADLLELGAVKPGSAQFDAFVGHIGSSGRHLLQLINDVLDLSKVEAGRMEFVPVALDLKQLVREVADTMQPALQRKQIRFEADVEDVVRHLTLDPGRLKQVLFNYLSNAVKFTPEGGRVTLRARAEGPRQVRIEVEDTGIGVADHDLPKLFTEFRQLDAGYDKRHQGTGLGLALVRRLIEAQGGTVGVRSETGVGSVFHVVLDREQQRRIEAEPDPRDAALRRLLLIASDLGDRQRMVRALGDAGFQVDVAETGAEALRAVRGTSYDAIALDLMLPDRGGLDLLGDIRRETSDDSSLPVMGLALPAGGDRTASFAIADVLAKPLRTEEIVAAMARHRRPAPHPTTVMVIDDDPLARDLMRATLSSLGLDAVCFDGGRAALERLDEVRPDLVILDLLMPEFDGFATLDALRRRPAGRDVPVFIWTSMVLTSAEYEGLAATARAVIGKGGGTPVALLEHVRRQWQRDAEE